MASITSPIAPVSHSQNIDALAQELSQCATDPCETDIGKKILDEVKLYEEELGGTARLSAPNVSETEASWFLSLGTIRDRVVTILESSPGTSENDTARKDLANETTSLKAATVGKSATVYVSAVTDDLTAMIDPSLDSDAIFFQTPVKKQEDVMPTFEDEDDGPVIPGRTANAGAAMPKSEIDSGDFEVEEESEDLAEEGDPFVNEFDDDDDECFDLSMRGLNDKEMKSKIRDAVKANQGALCADKSGKDKKDCFAKTKAKVETRYRTCKAD